MPGALRRAEVSSVMFWEPHVKSVWSRVMRADWRALDSAWPGLRARVASRAATPAADSMEVCAAPMRPPMTAMAMSSPMAGATMSSPTPDSPRSSRSQARDVSRRFT